MVTQFGGEGERIGLQRELPAVRANNFKFVGAAVCDIRDKNLPDPDISSATHDMAAAIPVIEVTHYGNPPGIGRPYGKVNARHAFVRNQMRAKLVVESPMSAFRDQKIIHGAQHGPESVRVGHPPLRARALSIVFDRPWSAKNLAFEQAALVRASHGSEPAPFEVIRFRALGAGYPDPRECAPGACMGAEQGKRVRMTSLQQGIERARRGLHKRPQISFAYSRMVRSEENQPI